MRKVKALIINWCVSGSVTEGVGEDYDKFVVGVGPVVSIEEFEPRNGLEVWNYLITFEDGSSCRVFNPNRVDYY